MQIESLVALIDQINEKSKRYEIDFSFDKTGVRAKLHRNDDDVDLLNIDTLKDDDDYEAELMASLAYIQTLLQNIDKSAQRDKA